MPTPSSAANRRTDITIVAAIGALFALINLRWIFLFRAGQPLEIDEAGYLAISLNYYKALMDGGFSAWIAAIEAPNIHAPLTMMLSSLAFALAVPNPVVGFAVIVGFGLLAIVSTYYLAELIGGRRLRGCQRSALSHSVRSS